MNKPTFRAWDEHEEEMLENIIPLFDADRAMIAIITDFQIIGSPGTSEIEIGSYDTTLNWDEFPYILMQSTGLKDKNGVESWQGNYLVREGRWTFFIDWLDEYGCLMAMPVNPVQRINWEPVPIKRMLEMGFVNDGNIHENPELLNEVE